MNQKYRNKYRIPSARAPWWDYGWNAAYFVTICTKDRMHHDHIIRNEKSFRTISAYIANNPLKWREDRFFPTHSQPPE